MLSLQTVPVPAEVPPAVLEAVVRAVAAGLSPRPGPRMAEPATGDEHVDLPALLSPPQVEALTGISRQTVDRMVRDGELPSIELRRGRRQRMVRVPKRFVLELLAELNAGTSICLADYTARWAASAADASGAGMSSDQAVAGVAAGAAGAA